MSTWSSVLSVNTSKQNHIESQLAARDTEGSYAVLDASALIGVSGLQKLADNFVTTPDVYEEVRDKASREAIERFPLGIQQMEPGPGSVSTVRSFAKATGDVHSLSEADLRIIALTYELHTQRFGSASLRHSAAPARAVSKGKQATQSPPGWGEAGGRWAEMDKLHEEETAAQETVLQTSRVMQGNQDLQLDHLSIDCDVEQRSMTDTGAADDPNGNHSGVIEAQPVGQDQEDSEWQLAACSHGAARKHRRQALRQQKRQVESQDQTDSSWPTGSVDAASQPWDQGYCWTGSGDSDSTSLPQTDNAPDRWTLQLSQESSICIATADFAMQNVILQMGLRLATPDGRRIKQISRWVLRCSACFKVTKEMQRMFCPACGNAALEKVEVIVGQDGAELYGVRKRHIIRGTKFSLPKPKGGKNSNDPVLREDVYIQRLPRQKARKSSTDTFTTEYDSNSWHDARYSAGTKSKGVPAALASWKHNPNERRHTRTNRR